jgi:hypothetical protein
VAFQPYQPEPLRAPESHPQPGRGQVWRAYPGTVINRRGRTFDHQKKKPGGPRPVLCVSAPIGSAVSVFPGTSQRKTGSSVLKLAPSDCHGLEKNTYFLCRFLCSVRLEDLTGFRLCALGTHHQSQMEQCLEMIWVPRESP